MPIYYLLKRIAGCCCLLLCLSLPLQAQDSTSNFRWTSCPDCPYPDVDTAFLRRENIQFGYLTVPENRQQPNGRKIRLAVQVFKAIRPDAGKPPMIILHGGPGGRAVGNFPPEYDSIRKESDIILIDQRGTGFSEPDLSPEMNQEILQIFAGDLSPEEETRQRVALANKVKDSLLKKGIDLQAINSREIAADIHDLCKLMGYTSWNLWGTSYGTRVALTMMRDFPEGINSVILASPLPPNVRYFENVTASFKRSLELLCDKCQADPACHQSYPHLKEDFIAAINGLEKNPITIDMGNAAQFPDGKFVINAQDMLLAIHQALYDRANYPMIPILIEQVKSRNTAALKRFVENMSNGIFRLKYGTYYSVICSECMPFNSVNTFKDSSAGYWQGITFYKDEFSICNLWNNGPFNALDSAAVNSNIPVLILSGEMDPLATVAGAEIAQRSLPNSYLYVFEGTGHFVVNEASTRLIYQFLHDPHQSPGDTHFIQSAAIPFITDIHISNGVAMLAPKLQLQKGNLLYGIWILLIVLLLLSSLWLAVKTYRQQQVAGKRVLPLVLMLLNVLVSAWFLAAIALAVLNTSRVNFQVLGFGLPESYAGALMLPYIVLAIYLVVALLWILNRQRQLTNKWYLVYFLVQIPFICFLLRFGLFY